MTKSDGTQMLPVQKGWEECVFIIALAIIGVVGRWGFIHRRRVPSPNLQFCCLAGRQRLQLSLPPTALC